MHHSTNIRIVFLICILFCIRKLYCIDETLPLGNFALPTALEPGPLFGFGQTIVDENDFLLLEEYYYQQAGSLKYNVLHSSLLYGITDNLSVYFNVPVILSSKQNNCKSAGVSDIFIQGEYAWFNYSKETYCNQATIVAAMSLPTGSISKIPQLGLGSPSFFIGATANHTSIKWYVFGALGGLLTTSCWNTKQGNQLFYEGGLGYNLGYKTATYILTGILELNGFSSQKNKINSFFDEDSGGNVIFFGPILFFSYKHINLQCGIQGALFQHVHGNQEKNNFRAAMEVGFFF